MTHRITRSPGTAIGAAGTKSMAMSPRLAAAKLVAADTESLGTNALPSLAAGPPGPCPGGSSTSGRAACGVGQGSAGSDGGPLPAGSVGVGRGVWLQPGGTDPEAVGCGGVGVAEVAGVGTGDVGETDARGVGAGVTRGVAVGDGTTVGAGVEGAVTVKLLWSVGNWPEPQSVVPDPAALSNPTELHVMVPTPGATPVIVKTARSSGGELPTRG